MRWVKNPCKNPLPGSRPLRVQNKWQEFKKMAAEVQRAANAGPMPSALMSRILAAWRALKFPLEKHMPESDEKIAAITLQPESRMSSITTRIVMMQQSVVHMTNELGLNRG